MAASKGLSVDGVNYFSSFMSGEKKPDWMQFGKAIGQLTGDFKVMEFITGFSGLQQFVFRTPRWPIGGMYFDGILRTEHTSRVRTTNYPVQTGVVMTDHAIIEPAELTIDVMMTDTATWPDRLSDLRQINSWDRPSAESSARRLRRTKKPAR